MATVLVSGMIYIKSVRFIPVSLGFHFFFKLCFVLVGIKIKYTPFFLLFFFSCLEENGNTSHKKKNFLPV